MLKSTNPVAVFDKSYRIYVIVIRDSTRTRANVVHIMIFLYRHC